MRFETDHIEKIGTLLSGELAMLAPSFMTFASIGVHSRFKIQNEVALSMHRIKLPNSDPTS